MSANRFTILLFGFVAFSAHILLPSAFAESVPSNVSDVLGPSYTLSPASNRNPPRHIDHATGASVAHWDGIGIDASELYNTTVAAGENRVYGEKFGPTRASRAMANVHI